jgi:hypothetical protein
MHNSKTPPVDINGRPYHRGLMLTVILIAAFAGGLMQTSLSTALPTLMTKFDISLSTAQQASTWFSLTSGIMVPLSAFLVNRFPVKMASYRWLYTIDHWAWSHLHDTRIQTNVVAFCRWPDHRGPSFWRDPAIDANGDFEHL